MGGMLVGGGEGRAFLYVDLHGAGERALCSGWGGLFVARVSLRSVGAYPGSGAAVVSCSLGRRG